MGINPFGTNKNHQVAVKEEGVKSLYALALFRIAGCLAFFAGMY
jgi:hypothetical protein